MYVPSRSPSTVRVMPLPFAILVIRSKPKQATITVSSIYRASWIIIIRSTSKATTSTTTNMMSQHGGLGDTARRWRELHGGGGDGG